MSDEMGRKCDELKCDDDRWRVGEHYAGSRGRSRTWTALVRDVQQICVAHRESQLHRVWTRARRSRWVGGPCCRLGCEPEGEISNGSQPGLQTTTDTHAHDRRYK